MALTSKCTRCAASMPALNKVCLSCGATQGATAPNDFEKISAATELLASLGADRPISSAAYAALGEHARKLSEIAKRAERFGVQTSERGLTKNELSEQTALARAFFHRGGKA